MMVRVEGIRRIIIEEGGQTTITYCPEFCLSRDLQLMDLHTRCLSTPLSRGNPIFEIRTLYRPIFSKVCEFGLEMKGGLAICTNVGKLGGPINNIRCLEGLIHSQT